MRAAEKICGHLQCPQKPHTLCKCEVGVGFAERKKGKKKKEALKE